MALPPQLKLMTLPDVETMTIKSEVLDPITNTDSVCVFQLPKTGTLDKGSMIQVAVVLDNQADEDKAFFPIATGVHSAIKSALLKVGNKVIATSEDHGEYFTALRLHKTADERAFKDMPLKGVCGDRWAVNTDSRIVYRDLQPDGADLHVPQFIKPTSSDDTTFVGAVMLSELFPAFRGQSLPLFAMKENVFIEITWSKQGTAQGDIGNILCGDSTITSLPCSISKPNIKFIYDGLYYSSQKDDLVMSKAMSSDGLTYLYEDLIETIASVPSGTAGQSATVERDLALSGRTCTSVLISEKPSGAKTHLHGPYISRDTVKPSTLNFRINDQRVYDRGITSAPRKYEEEHLSQGLPLQVPSQLYSFDVDFDDDANDVNQCSVYVGTVEGHQLCQADNTGKFAEGDLRGIHHYEGLDMSKTGVNTADNGTLIGAKPMRVEKTYQYITGDTSGRTMKVFAKVLRSMTIRNGTVIVSV